MVRVLGRCWNGFLRVWDWVTASCLENPKDRKPAGTARAMKARQESSLPWKTKDVWVPSGHVAAVEDLSLPMWAANWSEESQVESGYGCVEWSWGGEGQASELSQRDDPHQRKAQCKAAQRVLCFWRICKCAPQERASSSMSVIREVTSNLNMTALVTSTLAPFSLISLFLPLSWEKA